MSPRLFPRYSPIGVSCLFALLVIAPDPARADIPEMLACADKTADTERLACYDAAVVRLKKQLAEAQKRNFTLFGFQLPFTDGNNDQGSGTPKEPVFGPKEVDQISAHLVEWVMDYTGHVRFTLDNGQVWQVDDVAHVPLRQKEGTPLVIARNAFGGFFMSLNGQDTRLGVHRLH
jgi:hypothetical protein